MKLVWKYYRCKSHQASKWISGNNWVTKFDEKRVCTVGINGRRIDGVFIAGPKMARKYVEGNQ